MNPAWKRRLLPQQTCRHTQEATDGGGSSERCGQQAWCTSRWAVANEREPLIPRLHMLFFSLVAYVNEGDVTALINNGCIVDLKPGNDLCNKTTKCSAVLKALETDR